MNTNNLLAAIVGLLAINTVLNILNNLNFKKMADNSQKFIDALNSINESTNSIAAKLEDLKGQIAGSGMPAAKEEEILTQLQSAADALKAVANPDQPQPEIGDGNEPVV